VPEHWSELHRRGNRRGLRSAFVAGAWARRWIDNRGSTNVWLGLDPCVPLRSGESTPWDSDRMVLWLDRVLLIRDVDRTIISAYWLEVWVVLILALLFRSDGLGGLIPF
jgi:hypothetical protein